MVMVYIEVDLLLVFEVANLLNALLFMAKKLYECLIRSSMFYTHT